MQEANLDSRGAIPPAGLVPSRFRPMTSLAKSPQAVPPIRITYPGHDQFPTADRIVIGDLGHVAT